MAALWRACCLPRVAPTQSARYSLASDPRGVGKVKRCCQFPRNFVSLDEQVGEHIDGSGGCFACPGSAGMRGGSGGGAITVEV